MQWKKTPPELAATFEKARPKDPAVQSKLMFGYPAVFLNGNMFAGTFQDKIVIRVGKDPSFADAKNAKPFEPMPGRPMTGFVVVPDAVVKSPAKLREWIAEGLAYAKTMPPKGPKTAASARAANAKSARAAAKTSARKTRS
jgi:TfoX/Sxy family transcriptional regulator of competence genes